MSLVEIRPLPSRKWHGKKDGESFSQPKAVEVLYDPELGGYATGLTEEEANTYGKKLGVDLSSLYRADEPHTYWSTKPSWIVLPNHTIVFDTEKPTDFVKVKNMKASKMVANSMAEWEAGKFPDATHVIFDETEEVALKASKIEIKNKAIEYLGKMTLEDKINVVRVLSERSVKNQSADFITVEMDEIVTNKPKELCDLMLLGRQQVSIRSQILEMVSRNIITKENGSYFYMGELLGMDFDDVVGFFMNPNNSKMKVIMLQKLENI